MTRMIKTTLLSALLAASLSVSACKKDAPSDVPTGSSEAPAATKAEASATPSGDKAETGDKDNKEPGDKPAVDSPAADKAEAVTGDADAGDFVLEGLKLQGGAMELLEKHKTDPAKAAEALRAYADANKAKIAALSAKVQSLEAKFKDDPAALMAMTSKHMDKVSEFTKRMSTLISENPDLIANPEVQKAMMALSPQPGGAPDDVKPLDEEELKKAAEALKALDPGAGEGAGLSESEEQLFEQAIGHQEAIADLLVANQDDVEAAGNALAKYVEDNKASFSSLESEGKGLTDKLQKNPQAAMAIAQKYMGRLSALSQKMSAIGPKLPKMMENDKVKAAFEKLSLGGK